MILATSAAQTDLSPAHPPVKADSVVIERAEDRPLPPYAFSGRDAALLDDVQRGALAYFIHEVCPETGLVQDRSGADLISVAGVGYQLAAYVIGAERGWLEKTDAEARTLKALRSLIDEPSNRKEGLFYHFLNPVDATPRRLGTELVVSTIDSAILFSGAIAAGEYFGGEIEEIADGMVAAADWTFFQNGTVDFERGDAPSPELGFVSLGWRPDSDEDQTGAGSLIPYSWVDCGDEHRLVSFLGACAPVDEHRLPTEIYYQLRRNLGHNPWAMADRSLVAWFPYSGALFTAFFAHCWIDYGAMGTDDPAAHGQEHRASVDWWENSRRLVNLHRGKAIENPMGLPTFGPDAWGLSACDGPEGYLVPGVYPDPVEMIGAKAGRDFAQHDPDDNWGGGVVAPYAAASSIVFEPTLSVRAMRHYRSLDGRSLEGRSLDGQSPEGASGGPLAWRGVGEDVVSEQAAGRYGFVDSYRGGDDPWTAGDTVAIDHGPMIVLIENARSGLIWDLFHRDEAVRAGLERLGLARNRSDTPEDG